MKPGKLIGPFIQLLTMDNMPLKGPLADDKLEITEHAGVITNGDHIQEVGDFGVLSKIAERNNYKVEALQFPLVAVPGFVDPHTHICWAGNRAADYGKRLQGKTYTEIAASGGGIWDTVTHTRQSSLHDLTKLTIERVQRHLSDGVTTIEVKSGYGLTVEDELKMLRAIQHADKMSAADLIPTCLAAHICPKDFKGTSSEYLKMMVKHLLPKVHEKGLANRVDIYIDDHAFEPGEAKEYLKAALEMGFEITVHADQFSVGGSKVAIEAGAVSADHLEASGEKELQVFAENNVIPVALPGSSIGLGVPFAPARKLLDAGASLAIGSDWNPGSAPMGDLLVQACILGMYGKLTMAETLAAITYRAAAALSLRDRGIIKPGNIGDLIAFNVSDYKDIIYNQGKIKPEKIWKRGTMVK